MSQSIQEIKELLSGASLTTHRWGPERRGSREESKRAAEANEVKKERRSKYMKTIIDTDTAEWRALTSACTYCATWFDSVTFPYLHGQRLFYRERRQEILDEVGRLNGVVKARAGALDAKRQEILDEAKEAMGRSFDESLYPKSWAAIFWVEFREHNIDPPLYLQRDDAEEYKRELARRLGDIENSMKAFERQLMFQLASAAQGMAQNLGNDKVLTPNVESFAKLFDRCAQMKFEGTEVFKRAMGEAREIIDGVEVSELRARKGLRAETKDKLERLMSKYHQLQEAVAKKGRGDE
jgi:hypothetical protein